jgi:hypothetical protein
VRITIGIEEHVRLGLAALSSSLEEIEWKPADEATAQQGSEGEREFE